MAADLLTVSETARRSGFSSSALRYYEREGLISAERTSGGQRRFHRAELRRLAFIAAARHIGLSLDEIRQSLAGLPDDRAPTREEWEQFSAQWRPRLEQQIGETELQLHATRQQAREDAPYYQHDTIGYNYRMSNLLAAVGLGQLESIDQRVRRKREIFFAYQSALAQVPGIDGADDNAAHPRLGKQVA